MEEERAVESDFWERDEPGASAEGEPEAALEPPPPSGDPSAIVWSVDVPYSNRFEARTARRFVMALAVAITALFTTLYVAAGRAPDLVSLLFTAVLLGLAALVTLTIIRASGNKAHDGTFAVNDAGVTYLPGQVERRVALASAAIGGGMGRPSVVSVAESTAEAHTVLWKNVVRAVSFADDRMIELHGRLGGPLRVYCSEEVYDRVLDATKEHGEVTEGRWKPM